MIRTLILFLMDTLAESSFKNSMSLLTSCNTSFLEATENNTAAYLPWGESSLEGAYNNIIIYFVSCN
jgi:hypothetical protein